MTATKFFKATETDALGHNGVWTLRGEAYIKFGSNPVGVSDMGER